jgi:hypothetical protein
MLIVVGLALVVAGLVVTWVGKVPGDMAWRGKNWTVSFPLGTSLLLSVIASGLLWLWSRYGGGGK